MYKKPKLVVMGHARHGKDTVCELLSKFGYTSISSSYYALEHIVYPVLKDKYNYTSMEECFADRVNHREEWYNLIKAYNTPDLARLGKEILSTYDIYCGIRNREELEALKREKLIHKVIWVDASRRLPKEEASSISVSISDADVVLPNHETLEDLKVAVGSLVLLLDIDLQER